MKAVAVLCLAFLAGWPLVAPAQNTHTLPLVRPADFAGQESLVRIVNRSDTAGTVQVNAIDDTGERFGPVTLTLGARQALNITSSDWERGNAAKGLPVGVGDGEGSWRLELATALTIEPLAYIRTPDKFLTSMHDVAPMSEGGNHWVPFFNPGSNTSKTSHLRIINPGTTAAEVTVTGRDDAGDEASGTVRLTLPAGAARTLSAQALETGVGLDGRLGDGAGKWRLNVRSTTNIQVMSLLSTRTGHLANLSTVPEPPPEPPPPPPPEPPADVCPSESVFTVPGNVIVYTTDGFGVSRTRLLEGGRYVVFAGEDAGDRGTFTYRKTGTDTATWRGVSDVSGERCDYAVSCTSMTAGTYQGTCLERDGSRYSYSGSWELDTSGAEPPEPPEPPPPPPPPPPEPPEPPASRCGAGGTVSAGNPCTYKIGGQTFTLRMQGTRVCFVFFCAGANLRIINTTLNGVTLTMVTEGSGTSRRIAQISQNLADAAVE